MKKILIAYGALVLIVVALAVAKFNGFNFLPNINSSSAEIRGHKYSLMIAKDDKSRQVGLSNRKSLDENSAMLFIFEKKGKYSFWMKDTQIPLDIIYINDEKIVHIVKNAAPQKGNSGNLPIYTPPAEANYVLEINGGQSDKYKFANGDTIKFNGIK